MFNNFKRLGKNSLLTLMVCASLVAAFNPDQAFAASRSGGRVGGRAPAARMSAPRASAPRASATRTYARPSATATSSVKPGGAFKSSTTRSYQAPRASAPRVNNTYIYGGGRGYGGYGFSPFFGVPSYGFGFSPFSPGIGFGFGYNPALTLGLTLGDALIRETQRQQFLTE